LTCQRSGTTVDLQRQQTRRTLTNVSI